MTKNSGLFDEPAYCAYAPGTVKPLRAHCLLARATPIVEWTIDDVREHLTILTRRLTVFDDKPISRNNPWLTRYIDFLTRRCMFATLTDASLNPANGFVPLDLHDCVWMSVRLLQTKRDFALLRRVHQVNPLPHMRDPDVWRKAIDNAHRFMRRHCTENSTLMRLNNAAFAEAARLASLGLGERDGVRSRNAFVSHDNDAVSVLNERADVIATYAAYTKHDNESADAVLARIDALWRSDDLLGLNEQRTLAMHMLNVALSEHADFQLLGTVMHLHVDDNCTWPRFEQSVTRRFPFIFQLCGGFWLVLPALAPGRRPVFGRLHRRTCTLNT
jgi:hypothetical protein